MQTTINAKYLRVLVVFLLVISLVSCGQSGGTDENPGEGDGSSNKVSAQTIEITLDEDTPSAPIDVLQDIDDSSYSLASITQPTHGTSTINGNGLIEYQPAQDFSGDDTFTYTISDGTNAALTADIIVHVTPVNDAPVANAGGPYIIGLTHTFSPDGSQSYDVDGDALSYRWEFGDGTESTEAAPSKTYSFPDVYNVRLTVSDGSVDSQPVETTVNVVAETPFIAQQPQSASIQDGNFTTFEVQVLGNAPIQYQWRQNGNDIPGANDSTYRTPTIYLPSNTLSLDIEYDVVIINNLGQIASEVATLTINANQPFISLQPQSQTVVAGGQLLIRANAQGTPQLNFQWRKNGVNIAGATSTSLFFPEIIYGETDGTYDVVVTNVAGVVTSWGAQISVQPLPVTISQAPVPQVINEGETALFTVVAAGSEPITYQWQFNNVDIPGATATQLEITAAALSDSGDYRVVVTNPAGSMNSPATPLIVNKLPPEIITQPTPIVVVDGSSASFTVEAQDSESLSYQWRRNGVDIPGENSSTLLLTSVSMADHNSRFSVEVSNSAASVVSEAVPLGVTPAAPQIVAQPENVTVYEENAATFTVTVTGTEPLSYQWRRNGVNIPNATNPAYTVSSTQLTNNGESFDVIASNVSGSATSTSATLTVLPNAEPQAARDQAMTRKNNAVMIDVLGNDTDADNDTLSIQSASNGAIGDVLIIHGSPDTLLYTPSTDQVGRDTFTYVVDDGKGKWSVGEVVVHITPWGAVEIIGNGERPSLASSTANGDSFLSWRSGDNSASSIWGTRYVSGSSWVIPQAPFVSGVLLNNQQIHASYYGLARVLWQNTNTQTGVQFLQHAEWTGLDWVLGSVERPNPNVLDPISNLTFTTNNNTRFSAVWVETDAVTGNKRVAWSYDLGVIEYITDGSSDVDEPVMAIIDNNTPVFIWKDIATGNLLWRYGVTVIQPANDVLNERGTNIRQPQIALNGSGQGIIAWLYDSNDTVLQTRSITVTDYTTDPVLGSALSHPLGRNVLEAKLAVAENGDIAIVWSQQEVGGTAIWIKRITASKEAIEKLSLDPSLQPVNPDVTINSNGLITVVWEEQGNVVSRRFEANGVWSQVENLDDAYGGNSSHVVVDSTDNGQVTTAWQRDNGEIVASIANIDLANVTPLPVNHTDVVTGSCNNSGCHSLSTDHIVTAAECDTCHFNTSWKPVIDSSDHATLRVCSSCHDDVIEQGKGSSHIQTSYDCNVCHTTEAWVPTQAGGAPDHTIFVNNCVDCHDGVTASGKTPSHINTANLCDACHMVFPATWAPVAASAVDHSQVIGICASCHNNVLASGKPGNHPATTDICDACHYVAPSIWRAIINPLDHSQVIGTCVSCHNTVTARGKPASHPATTDMCDACHYVPPASWLPTISPLDHSEIFGLCSACHSLPAGHCATILECDYCHLTTSWNAFADCAAVPPPPPPPAPPGLPPPPPPPSPSPAPNLAPVANPGGPYESAVNLVVFFDGSLSYDPEGAGLTYSWNFGDGAIGTGIAPTHVFTSECLHTITLVVNDGVQDSAPVTTTAAIVGLGGGMGGSTTPCAGG